ncbi:ABC transporter substrate-binding protein [Rhizobium oryzicola]|uniref:ABC transporter substrate-binding protein n=1 Tax=Rhizobium oryzicola TaxID=1232668 RepID=A0ABT8T3D8_9HYPH|nr:ABC transporter substrate-binding protein [Rhizobium oryzicola]MDO1584944.1 ABC transporter substrate-binding protein [Rhizobium oryzicola]
MKLTKIFLGVALAATSLAQTANASNLRMSWWGGDSRHKATQVALKACGDKYGHTIAAEFTGWDGHLEKVTTQIAGGTEADIMQINWPWLPLFSINGDGFADLNQYKDIIDLSQWTKDDLAAGTMNGKLNGLSVSTTGRVFMFNKTALDKAGVAIPKTWDELFAAAKTLKTKVGPEAYPMNAVKETAVLLISLYTTQNTGKDLVDQKAKKVAWSAEELAKGIDFYGKLVKEGVVQTQKSVASEGNLNLFESPKWADGRISGSYEWDSTFSKYADPLKGQKLEPVSILKNTDAKTEGVYRKPSMVFSISKRSKDPKAAAQILNCLLNEPEGINAMGTARGLPASKIAAKTLIDGGKIEPEIVAANAIIMNGTGPTVSPLNEHPEVRAVFIDTLEEYAYGQIKSQEAAEAIIDGVNAVLKKF